ncbi:MAG: membrane protein insertion efficiency factor YidD [Spirochaetota bacterium]
MLKYLVMIFFVLLLSFRTQVSEGAELTARDVLLKYEGLSGDFIFKDRQNLAGDLLKFIVDFYQKRISIQNESRCLFYPTCSDFYIKAIDAYGVFRATLMVIDRLLYREGEWSVKYYSYMEASGRYYDPIHHNYIFRGSDYYR